MSAMQQMLAGYGGGAADPLFSSVVSLAHFDGLSASTTFNDQKGKVWTPAGNAQLSTAQAKWGPSALLLDGAGDYLSTPHSTDFNAAGASITAEMWIRPAVLPTSGSTVKYLMRKGTTVYTAGWLIGLYWDGTKAVAYNQCGDGTDTPCIGVTALALNTWAHIAAVWVSALRMRIFVNGVLETTQSIGAMVNNTEALSIGYDPAIPGTRDFSGYVDDVRVTRAERYTSSFAVPTAPFPNF